MVHLDFRFLPESPSRRLPCAIATKLTDLLVEIEEWRAVLVETERGADRRLNELYLEADRLIAPFRASLYEQKTEIDL